MLDRKVCFGSCSLFEGRELENVSDQQMSSRSIWLSLLPMILYTAVLPYVIFRLASPHMSTVTALLLAAVPPAFVTVLGLVRQRRFNLLGSLALVGISVKLMSALFFRDVRLVLLSDSLMIGVYGLLMLGSLIVQKPLLLMLARNALAGAPPAERAQLEQRWLARGRSGFTFITALWGTGLLLAFLVNVGLVYSLTVAQFVLVGPLVHYSMFGLLIVVSQAYGFLRRRKKPETSKEDEL